jgi:ATP-dependent DNA helicase HFM1/MER3
VKLKRQEQDDLDEVEVIDLVDGGSQSSKIDLTSKDSHKLHKLHTSIQKDKDVRLPKQKPQFSYTNGKASSQPFPNNSQATGEAFDYDLEDEDDLPSPSALFRDGKVISAPFQSSELVAQDQTAISSIHDNSLESLEAAMIGLGDSMELRQQTPSPKVPTPRVTSSFANRIFDFDRYSEDPEEDRYSSPLMRESRKRVRPRSGSPTPELPTVKRQRVKKPDLLEEKESPYRDHIQQETFHKPSVPSWVDGTDQSILDDLKDIVDFVD